MAVPLALAGYWLFLDRVPPFTVGAVRLVTAMPVAQGESFAVAREVCVHRPGLSGVIQRSFVDGVIFNTPAGLARLPAEAGCATRVFSAEVPDALPPGRYRYVVEATYRINPLTDRRMDFGAVEIVVVRAPGAMP